MTSGVANPAQASVAYRFGDLLCRLIECEELNIDRMPAELLREWQEATDEHIESTAPAAAPPPQAAAQAPAAPLTESYVQPVPDKCDRITWRGRYYHLETLAAPAQASQPCELCNALIVPRNMTHYDAIDLSAAQKRAEILHSRIKIEHDPVAQAAQPERSCDKIADALRECLPLVAGLAAGLQDDGEDAAAAVALAVIEVSKKRLAEYAAQAAHSAPVAWYSAKVDDCITNAKKVGRAKYQPWDAEHYDQPLYAPTATQTPRPNEPELGADGGAQGKEER